MSESHLDLQLSEVMSNRELKVITAVVVGTRELLAVVHRMQAQRVIHFRHDGRTIYRRSCLLYYLFLNSQCGNIF